MAVGDDLGPLGQPDELSNLFRRLGHARCGEERSGLQIPRSKDVPLPGVARVSILAAELVLAANVEDRQIRIVQPLTQLVDRGHGLEPRIELVSVLVQLHHPLFELSRPGRQTAGHHRHRLVAGQLRELRRRRCPDAVAAVVEDEPLLPRHPMTAQAQGNLGGERGHHLAVGHRRR